MNIKKIYIILCFLVIPIASAVDLQPPNALTSAQVLPKKVWSFRYDGQQVLGNDKYGNQGERLLLADPFFRSLSWNDITDPRNDEIDKGLLRGYLLSKGFNLQEELGRSTGALSINANVHVPIIAYGITENLTLAVAVPIVNYQSNASTGFIPNENYFKLERELIKDGKTYELEELRQKMLDPIATKLALFGYKPLGTERRTKLGNVNLIFKYQLLNQDQNVLSVQNAYLLPTSTRKNVDKVIDVGGGEGHYNVGLSFIYDNNYFPRMVLTSNIGGIIQFKTTSPMRIPYRQDSKLTPDIDYATSCKYGNMAFMGAGVKYFPMIGLNINTGYTLQYKDVDVFLGNKYSPDRYSWLSSETIQNMHTLQLGIGYSTIELFRQNIFPLPFEVNANYSMVLKGKNVPRDSLTSIELVMFLK